MTYQYVVEERPSTKTIATMVTVIEEARKQIPIDLEDYTFFGIHDTWVYHAVFDTKLCVLCQAKTVPFTYSGIHLRAEFPDLEIESENRIGANVHINCRCYLQRDTPESPPIGPRRVKMVRKLRKVKER